MHPRDHSHHLRTSWANILFEINLYNEKDAERVPCPLRPGCALAWGLVASFYLAYLALQYMSQAVVDLCNALSPEQAPVSLDNIRWPLVCSSTAVLEHIVGSG
jgi:hypothetical protein